VSTAAARPRDELYRRHREVARCLYDLQWRLRLGRAERFADAQGRLCAAFLTLGCALICGNFVEGGFWAERWLVLAVGIETGTVKRPA
jgi:hypothetical protein